MNEKAKTKKELLDELTALKQELANFQSANTGLQKDKETLEKREKFISNIFSSIQEGISVIDKEMNILFVNPTMERWFPDIRPLIGKKCYQAYHGRDQICEDCPCRQTLQTGEAANAIIPRMDDKGKITGWFHHFSYPMLDPEKGRVIGVIEYVRNVTKQKQAEDAFNVSEEKYRSFIDSLPDGYYETDLAGHFTFLNKQLKKTFGYTGDQLLGTNNRSFTDAENSKKLYQAFTRVYKTGEPAIGFRFETITPQKTRRQVEHSISLVKDGSGKPVGFRGISRDITNLIETQTALKESEERYRTIIETMEEGYYENDLAGNLTFVNEAMARVLGFSRAELQGMNNRQYIDAESAKRVYQAFNQVYRTGEPARAIQYEVITKNGEKRTVETSASLIRNQSGNPVGFRGISRDITDLIKTQTALKASEERYRTIIETIEDGYYEVNLEGRLTFFNDAMARINGYSREEMMGLGHRDYTDAENAELLNLEFTQVYRTQTPSRGIHYEVITKNGEKKDVETSISLIRDHSGKPVGFRGIARDVSDLIKIQQALKESEERYRTIIETIEDGYYEVNLAGNFTYFNDALSRIHRDSRDNMMGMNFREYTDAQNAEILYQTFNQVYQTGEPFKGIHYEVATKNGRWDVEASVSLIRDSSGKPIGFRGISRDITDLIQIQTALKESEERYRTIIETIADGYYEVNLAGNLTFFNDQLAKTYGFPREVLMGMNNRVYTDAMNAKRMSQAFNRVQRTGEPESDFRFESITSEMTRKNMELSIALIRDPFGNPVGFRGIARDVSDLIKIQQALKESEERYRTIIETIEDGYYEVDLAGNLTYFNDTMVRIHEYSREELLGMNNRQYTDAENAKIIFKAFNRVYRTGEPSSGTSYEIITKEGKKKNLEASVSLIRDSKGSIIGFRGIIRDVTELKQAQKALQTSEERFRVASESSNDFISEWDIRSGRIDWYGKAVEQFGDMVGKLPATVEDFDKLIHPEDRERISEAIRNHLRHGKPYLEEYRLIGSQGDVIHVKSGGMGLRDKAGRAYKWIGALSDITERKKAEEDLKESLDKLHKAVGGIIQAMALTVESKDPYTAGHQQRVSNLARTIAQEMGLANDQVEAVRMAGVVHDLGKISVPSEILSKPTKLTDLEFSLIKGHSQTSYDILKDIDFPWPIALIALQHHERMDGSGYPSGLKGDQILLEAQILMVADVVEAIASHRPYRPALGIEVALDEILKNKGKLFNPSAVDACVRLFKEKGFSFS